jgi:putative hemolysin
MGEGPGGHSLPGMGELRRNEQPPHPGRSDKTVGIRVRRAVARILVRGADAVTRWVVRLLGENPSTGRLHISQAELRDLVAHSDVLDGEERRLIDEVIAAGSRHVRELMVPRTEVVFLDATATLDEAARLVRSARHSRFPVIAGGSHDDVIGFVHLRDLLIRPDGDRARTVVELARPLRTLPASKRLLAALSEMRREGVHLALVVDEYGGTAGIVSLEDLLEELVGEIHDEYDATPEPGLPDGTRPSEVDGLLNLNDFAERAGFALPSGPYDTVGGFVMATLARLPKLGDEVLVPTPAANYRLTVVGMDGRRIARIGLSPAPTATDLAVPGRPAGSRPLPPVAAGDRARSGDAAGREAAPAGADESSYPVSPAPAESAQPARESVSP